MLTRRLTKLPTDPNLVAWGTTLGSKVSRIPWGRCLIRNTCFMRRMYPSLKVILNCFWWLIPKFSTYHSSAAHTPKRYIASNIQWANPLVISRWTHFALHNRLWKLSRFRMLRESIRILENPKAASTNQKSKRAIVRMASWLRRSSQTFDMFRMFE